MKSRIVIGSFILLSLLTSVRTPAQDYKTGVGLRLSGWNSGITLKHFIGGANALEGIFALRHRSMVITGLYEKHTEFPKAQGLTWFFGGGAHVGFYNNGYGYYRDRDRGESGSVFGPGLDFILGLDYKFKNAPVNLSLDIKPYVDFVDGFYGYWDGALSVRFTL
ncbi:MAG: hypothetical protein RL213_927 [Bacteroidota bacterium]